MDKSGRCRKYTYQRRRYCKKASLAGDCYCKIHHRKKVSVPSIVPVVSVPESAPIFDPTTSITPPLDLDIVPLAHRTAIRRVEKTFETILFNMEFFMESLKEQSDLIDKLNFDNSCIKEVMTLMQTTVMRVDFHLKE